MNYPRLNEFPEWFALQPGARYAAARLGEPERIMSAEELELGIVVALDSGTLSQYMTVRLM